MLSHEIQLDTSVDFVSEMTNDNVLAPMRTIGLTIHRKPEIIILVERVSCLLNYLINLIRPEQLSLRQVSRTKKTKRN